MVVKYSTTCSCKMQGDSHKSCNFWVVVRMGRSPCNSLSLILAPLHFRLKRQCKYRVFLCCWEFASKRARVGPGRLTCNLIWDTANVGRYCCRRYTPPGVESGRAWIALQAVCFFRRAFSGRCGEPVFSKCTETVPGKIISPTISQPAVTMLWLISH